MSSPVTKLEAVNIMLSVTGEAPVTQLNSGLVEADVAETILESVNREVQGQGFDFNRELNVTFNPDSVGNIVLPANILRADATQRNSNLDLVQRGLKMYNRKSNTFIITQTVYLDIVTMLDFEDLPEVAKRFITIRAARIFLDRTVGSTTLHGFTEKDEARSLAELKEMDGEGQDFNIFNNFDTYQVINRVAGKRVTT